LPGSCADLPGDRFDCNRAEPRDHRREQARAAAGTDDVERSGYYSPEKISSRVDSQKFYIKQKNEIESQIESLLSSEKQIVMPSNFSLNNEILSLLKESGENGIPVLALVDKMQEKFPTYGMDRKKVASSVAYLKNTKKMIEKAGRGVYRIARRGVYRIKVQENVS